MQHFPFMFQIRSFYLHFIQVQPPKKLLHIILHILIETQTNINGKN